MSIIQLQRSIRRTLRRSEAGQSVVILAIGMVGLLAVVGIAVDISILFVRFNTLRRAVDSAAIAAAGQMRQDRTIAEAGLAARQFIEFHNLDPRDVLIETCHTVQVIDLDPDTDGVQRDEELCTADQRKLVRVTAEIESPTVFLQLLGFRTITLRASSISETAVLDVMLILDVSESMLTETDIVNDWSEVNQGFAYVPPRAWSFGNLSGAVHLGGDDPGTVFGQLITNGTYNVPENDINALYNNFDAFWQTDLLGLPQGVVNNRLEYNNPASPYNVRGFDATGTGTQSQPREECRVRFYPFAQNIEIPDELMDLYTANGHNDWVAVTNTYNGGRWSGFVPTYNFYGCCNDPGNGTVAADGTITPGVSVDPDGDFSDLVCQPFKQARDATREFLERIDFLRGDRVGFVTFDRTAFLIDPDGGGAASTHMIEDLQTATDTLNQMIGVRAEPNFYDWNEVDGGWSHGGIAAARYAIGFNAGGSIPADFNETNVVDAFGGSTVDYNNYPVFGNCPFQNAALPFPFSRYATQDADAPPGTLPDGSDVHFSPALWNVMTPDLLSTEWNGIANTFNLTIQNSYELWASCRGTNIGAALREANNALTDPTTNRREGTVWVMVMLSDGAAGASDPARRRGDAAIPANPYAPSPDSDPANGVIKFGTRGEYGAFGVCPYGLPSNFGELTDTQSEAIIEFPFCLDERPETRHFCLPSNQAIEGGDSSVGVGDSGALHVGFGPGALGVGYDFTLSPADNAALGNIYDLDVGDFPIDGRNTVGPAPDGEEFCDLFYDVDDYARDWANFIVGIVPGQGSETVILDGVLPTIFTIGFGLNFDNGDGSCDDNVADCLGEELLRYIADAGDNFTIDTNYQQDYLDNLLLDASLSPTEYGAPGICEPPDVNAGDDRFGGYVPGESDTIEFLTPRENCGNYFNAPNEQELALVFDEIASRMFTRLTG